MMSQRDTNPIPGNGIDSGKLHESSNLASRILSCANRGPSTVVFLDEVSRMLLDFTGCDAVELRVIERDKLLCCEVPSSLDGAVQTQIMPGRYSDNGVLIPCLDTGSDLERICEEIANNRFDPSLPFFTARGSFLIGNTKDPLELSSETCKWAGGRTLHIGGDFASLAVIPFLMNGKEKCFLLLKSKRRDFFSADKMHHCEQLGRIVGIALNQLHAQVALRERVKELTCLYGIAQVAARPDISLDEILEATARLLPPGWLYPEIASARVYFDDRSYMTPSFMDNFQRQKAEIVVNGGTRGSVEVAYSKEMPELDEGPFLKEERNLIDAVAKELALIIERKQAEEEREKLQEQLLHADRLATIGQLAAGVAHELNEPLGSILGFAQLVQKDRELPGQAQQDVGKIITASLHAREVVNKLMLFARQAPARKGQVNINKIVEEGLYFLESRCAKAGVELRRIVAPGMPEIWADAGQVLQVLVNLVVNALQAMPNGGHLTIQTEWHDPHVALIVEDTGVGMENEILDKIFMPFFTTKDVDEGTGLGLAVVQGIMTSHDGSVSVDSEVGRGTRFTVQFPIGDANQQNKQEKPGHAKA